MADEDKPDEGDTEPSDDEQSFRERVEEIREKRSEEREGEEDPRERMEEMMGGGGGPGGMGGGNPFAQMMGGMMGGGPGGMGAGRETDEGNVRVARELEALRDEVKETNRQLTRIADALEDD